MIANCPHCDAELNKDNVMSIKKHPSRKNKEQGDSTIFMCKECSKTLPPEAME
jgi:hypothetical protein